MQKTDHSLDIRSGERIADLLRLAPRVHQAVRAKPGEVLRQGRLAEIQRGAKFVDRALLAIEIAQNHQAAAVGQRLEHCFGLRRLRCKIISFHIAIFVYYYINVKPL